MAAGFTSNYKDCLLINYIYFTVLGTAPAWPPDC